jgi:ribosomal protein S18 acetylase RimI-like enzyme
MMEYPRTDREIERWIFVGYRGVTTVIVIERRAPAGERETRQFTAIYEASFPPEERDDTQWQLAKLHDGTKDCYLAVDGDYLAGFAIVSQFTDFPAVYLEYLAVDPAARNAGIGRGILDQLRHDWSNGERPDVKGIIFEVERPEDARDDPERELRERRIGFYQRAGAALVDGASNYHAPANTDQGTLHYLLMWLPVVPGAPTPTGARLRTCVTALLAEGYGLGQGNPLVRELVTDLG